MSTSPAVPAPPAAKPSLLKRIGQVIGKVLSIIAGNVAPAADMAAKVAEVMLPQFAPLITTADNLIDNIAKEAIAIEGTAAAAATAVTGPAKLAAVLTNIGPDIDAWVAAKFPGANAITAASKAGLVNAVVAILNEVDPATVTPLAPSS
jgi:hypothetical protein